jgi:hypothetical protein
MIRCPKKVFIMERCKRCGNKELVKTGRRGMASKDTNVKTAAVIIAKVTVD